MRRGFRLIAEESMQAGNDIRKHPATGLVAGAGTTPEGAASEQEAARWVRDMFGAVAPRYDLMNRLLSGSVDTWWRRRTVKRLSPILRRPDARILDLCCGTGDLLIAMERHSGRSHLGSDFCFPMLSEAASKLDRGQLRSRLFDADGLQLPLADNSLDLITVAFGFRNFTNYRYGLSELQRVLAPGGVLAVLEFSTPPNPVFRRLYDWYSYTVMPRLGGWISGNARAYTYLPNSIRKFPAAPELATWMKDAGFQRAEFDYMTFGVVALHIATK